MNALRDNPMQPMTACVLDFPGFYESCLSSALDDAENMEAENIIETHPDLDMAAVHEALYRHSDYGKGFRHIAEASVGWLNHVLEDTGIELVFESMRSPREYNFTTDRLFVILRPEHIPLLRAKVDEERFAKVIRDNFTSRDGFISFYSNDITDWREKPLGEWDHNELGTLLTTFLRQQAEEKDLDDPYAMLEWMQEDFYSAVTEQVDWDALHAALGIEQ